MKIIDSILEPYQIHKDSMSYTLVEPTGNTDKKGNELFKTHGYYSKLENAISRVVKLLTESKKEVFSLKEYLDELKELNGSIEKTIKQ